MARKRTVYGPDVEAKIRSGLERGQPAEAIAKELTAAGVKGASRATIDRRMREMRGRTASPRLFLGRRVAASDVPSPPLPESPEDIPSDADPDTIGRWIALAEQKGQDAANRGDLAGFGAMGRLAATLLEHRRKAAPPPRVDPNERPDMIAAKERARADFHRLIDRVANAA
ncbi:MAG: hypothetical protein FWD73_06970 [Polyangiaceae bacterium]|nr:hypothetical protein [Polyangiaceae bacterium]